MHIHLDLLGGISGDMFIGAMLDCFPDHENQLSQVVEDAGFSDMVDLQCRRHNDGILSGTCFNVIAGEQAERHDHRHYKEIREIISGSALNRSTQEIALAIFALIAQAEASVHGCDIDQVAFHEVGAWDSIADVICAASLISECNVSSWSVSRLPLGKGRVKTAHGQLPVPAPATSLMLQGFEFFDDGIEGERITPTGAAILKYVNPASAVPEGAALKRSGFGFGSKKFPGISNVLRLLVFDTDQPVGWDADQVVQLEFEVDDQSAEEIGHALELIRGQAGVNDVVQFPGIGKKGRQSTSIRVLANPEIEQSLTEYCFKVTSTLGIRHQLTMRSILRRSQLVVQHDGKDYRVKIAMRPGGPTAKVEMDDLAADTTVRHQVEGLALEQFNCHPERSEESPDEQA